MAETDTSSYGKPITSPFETLGALTNIQNASNQNKLFQQQYQTNLGVGQAYKTAIRPDGTIDQSALNQLIQSNPNVAVGLPQIYQGSQEAQKRQQDIQSQQIDVARKNVDTLGSYISPLAALGSKVTVGDVMGAAAKAITAGHVDPKVISQVLSDLPADNSAVPAWLQQQQMRFMSIQEQFNAMHPAPTAINTGLQTQLVRTPQIGAPSIAGTLNNTPPPSTQVIGPDGRPHLIGSGGGGVGGAMGGNPGGLGQQTGFAPGEAEAATVAATGSAGAYQALRNDVGASGTRVFQLNKALTALEGTNTGPGTETTNNIRSFLQAQTPDSLKQFVPDFDPDKTMKYDEANKYLTAFASGAAGSIGPKTNEQLATALSANASTKISNLAAKDVVKANIALEKMKQAAAIQFKNSGEPPQNFSDWYANYNKLSDPRAFLADQQSAKDRRSMLDKMNSKEQASYLNSFKAAIKSGVINLADLPK